MTSWAVVVCAWVLSTCLAEDSRTKRTVIGGYPRCPEGCTSCSAPNGCVTCRSGLYLYIQKYGGRQVGACVELCPQGYFSVNKQEFSVCKQCSQKQCESCTSGGSCTKCQTPLVLYQGTCSEKCPEGLHATYSGQCVAQTDCILSDWGLWSPCRKNGQTCGYKYGSQSRSRGILQEASPGGKQCDDMRETRRCRLLYRHCSDLLSNSSDPPRRNCPVTKKEKQRWRRKYGKNLPKQCRTNNNRRKSNKKQKQKKKDKKHKSRNKKKERTSQSRKTKGSLMRIVKQSLLLSPDLKTNNLNDFFLD